MNENNINKLIENIKYIEDKKSNEKLDIKQINSIKWKAKYSNIKNSCLTLQVNDMIIKKNNNYRVCYKCISCDHEHIVNLYNIIRKMHKNIINCNVCKNQVVEKKEAQSEFMKTYNPCRDKDYIKKDKFKLKKLSTMDFITKSINEFNEMDNDYQDQYFNKYLTFEEFENIRSHIISFQNDKFIEMKNFIYYPTIKIGNQTLFNPQFYDKERDILEKIIYIKMKCEKCFLEFINRYLYIQKNRIKIYCQDCNFCNKTFKIRTIKNYKGNSITYQSKLEFKFVMFCNKNKIIVSNGPKVIYNYNGKKRKYIVDFYLPESKLLIELKDDHIWHKKQVENGIWNAKMEAINNLIKTDNSQNYIIIFPKEFSKKTKDILNILNKI